MAELGYDSFHAGWHPVARVVAPFPACNPHDLRASNIQGDPSQPDPSGTDAPVAHVPWPTSQPTVAPSPVKGPAGPSDEAIRTWDAWLAGARVDSAEWLQRTESSRGIPAGRMAGDMAATATGPSSSALVHSHPAHAHGRPFRFAVNVEVIVHGNTEPDALVTAGGRPLPLRADGSFSVRWLLPDGEHRVPLVAVARDGKERRDARLRLGRATDLGGGVGVHALAAGPADPITGWAG